MYQSSLHNLCTRRGKLQFTAMKAHKVRKRVLFILGGHKSWLENKEVSLPYSNPIKKRIISSLQKKKKDQWVFKLVCTINDAKIRGEKMSVKKQKKLWHRLTNILLSGTVNPRAFPKTNYHIWSQFDYKY